MKKWLKILVVVISVTVLCLGIDLICIFTINKPLFAIPIYYDGSTTKVYKGILYDTYDCAQYSIPQIKAKWTKFSCAVDRQEIGKVVDIIDTTKDIKNFSCAEVLEQFYEDAEYTYYYNCIKGKYIIVKYENGYEETVKKALNYGTIVIDDLDQYNINYIKQSKENDRAGNKNFKILIS